MRLRSRTYGWYVLGLLTAANFLHYGNRNVLFPMYEDLRAVFGFSSSDLGLLGTAYMVTHALVSLPFGWAGDRFDRRRVLALGLAVWSVASVGSAAAAGLGSMLLSRALVGVGTAACVPVANALLCQLFPDAQKARIVSIFNVGLFLGGAAGFGVGATLGYPAGVLIMALPGVLLVLLVATLDVPARGAASPDVSFAGFLRQARELLQVRTLRWLVIAAVLMAFAAGGYLAWFFELMVQDKGMDQDKAFVVFGISLTSGLVGVLTGGAVGDRLQRKRGHGRMAAISLGMGCAVPFALVAVYVDTGALFYPASCLTMFFITWYHGPMAAVVDDLAKSDRATTAQALVIFIMHFFGTAPSSWVVGVLAEEAGLRHALLVPTGALLVAALVLMGGWRSAAADQGTARAGKTAIGTL